MALPKRRISRARGRRRRTHYRMTLGARSTCTNCQEIKPPHVVCPHCGWYNGRQVIKVGDAE